MLKSQILQSISGKSILITGGTGSFGNYIIRELFAYNPATIIVFSRDEKKQYDMQLKFHKHSNIRYVLGDVRDLQRVREVMKNKDIVYHAAALKQVPQAEYAPYEAVCTNIIGTHNVRRAAIEANVEKVLSISTDKAVKPVNVMGMTKAVQERIMLQPIENYVRTKFVCVRYGNVLGSRGSVVPVFIQFIKKKEPLPITHPEMTRFLLTLSEAARLVLWTTVKGEHGDLWVSKMPAAKVTDLGRALAFGITGRMDYPQHIVGIRPGEKLHEILVSEEEMWRATELESHFIIPSWFKHSYEHGPTGGDIQEYSSETARRLNHKELIKMLKLEGWLDRGKKDE